MATGPMGARRLTAATRARTKGPDPTYRPNEAKGAGLEARLGRVARQATGIPRPGPWPRPVRPTASLQAARPTTTRHVVVVLAAIEDAEP